MMDLLLQKTQERVLNIARGLGTSEENYETEEETEAMVLERVGQEDKDEVVAEKLDVDEGLEGTEDEIEPPSEITEQVLQEEDIQSQE